MQGAGRGGHCGETENDLGDDLYDGNNDHGLGETLLLHSTAVSRITIEYHAFHS